MEIKDTKDELNDLVILLRQSEIQRKELLKEQKMREQAVALAFASSAWVRMPAQHFIVFIIIRATFVFQISSHELEYPSFWSTLIMEICTMIHYHSILAEEFSWLQHFVNTRVTFCFICPSMRYLKWVSITFCSTIFWNFL